MYPGVIVRLVQGKCTHSWFSCQCICVRYLFSDSRDKHTWKAPSCSALLHLAVCLLELRGRYTVCTSFVWSFDDAQRYRNSRPAGRYWACWKWSTKHIYHFFSFLPLKWTNEESFFSSSAKQHLLYLWTFILVRASKFFFTSHTRYFFFYIMGTNEECLFSLLVKRDYYLS